MSEFMELNVFQPEDNKPKLVVKPVEPTAIGVPISKQEADVLILPPKFAVHDRSTHKDFTMRMQTCNAKLRYQVSDKCGETDVDPELAAEANETISSTVIV